MKKLVLFAAAATTAATALASPSSAALTAGPTGAKCRFNSATDVTAEAGWQTGQINAGPIYAGASGTLHCKVMINGDSHSGTAVVDVPGTAVGGVVVIP